MALFGIKKVNEDSKSTGTFINENVINAVDYSNMSNNTVVGYAQPTDGYNIDQTPVNYNVNNGETFVYTQVSNTDFNNQYVNSFPSQEMVASSDAYSQDQSVYTGVAYTEPIQVNQQVENMYNSEVVDDVIVTVDNATYDGDQGYNSGETVAFDNSALFALPAGAVAEESIPEVEEAPAELEVLDDEPEVILDPLNNANNPIPVNPVATMEPPKVEEVVEEEIPLFDEEEEVKTNLFTVLNMMVGMVIKPGTTISINARKYKRISDALLITFWVTIFSFVMCLIGRIVVGCFSRTENAISGVSKIVIDFSGLFDVNNYIPYLLMTLFVGLGIILVVAFVYYLSSFIFSKGIHVGTYFAISTLAVVPVIIGFTILYPIILILSSGIAMMALIFTIIYALIVLFTGINEVLKFKSNDQRILYNSVNMAIIFSVVLFIFKTLSYFDILDLSMFM